MSEILNLKVIFWKGLLFGSKLKIWWKSAENFTLINNKLDLIKRWVQSYEISWSHIRIVVFFIAVLVIHKYFQNLIGWICVFHASLAGLKLFVKAVKQPFFPSKSTIQSTKSKILHMIILGWIIEYFSLQKFPKAVKSVI